MPRMIGDVNAWNKFASDKKTIEVKGLGEQNSKDITGLKANNKKVSEVGRTASLVEAATPVLTDEYRDGGEALIRVPLGGDNYITVSQWRPVSRKIDTISDDIKGNLASIRFVDANTKGEVDTALIPPSSKFFLESVTMGQAEKYQLIETFGQYYVFFYGQRPPVYSFSGQLLNIQNHNWRLEFMHYYQNYWRGTQAVLKGAMIALTFSYEIVYGYMLGINTSITAVNDLTAPFNFTFLVVDVKPIPQMRDKGYNLTPTDVSPQEIASSTAYNAAKSYHKGDVSAVNPKKTSPLEDLVGQLTRNDTYYTPSKKPNSVTAGGVLPSLKFLEEGFGLFTPAGQSRAATETTEDISIRRARAYKAGLDGDIRMNASVYEVYGPKKETK